MIVLANINYACIGEASIPGLRAVLHLAGIRSW